MSERQVRMAGLVAKEWLARNSSPEYRISVYAGNDYVQNLPSRLRAFRDGRQRIGSIAPIRDLGIKAGVEVIEIWSSNREGMVALDQWLAERGCETTGVW